jgi:PAS domain S-box-containing protein
VRVQGSTSDKPLYRYIRELVWLNHAQQVPVQPPRNQSMFHTAWAFAPIGMVLSDVAGRIKSTNPTFNKMLGYAANELAGMQVSEVSDPSGREKEVALGNQVLSGALNNYEIKKRFFTKVGKPVDTVLSIAVIRNADGTPRDIIAQVLDVSILHHLRQQLARAEKRSALGKLARGIAHDFNNILTVIAGLTEPEDEPLPHPPDTQRVDALPSGFTASDQRAVYEAARAGARLTHQLLAFGGQDHQTLQPVNVNEHVNQLTSLMRGSLPNTIHLSIELHPDPLWVMGHPNQLEQIVLNLVFNARDAMPQGGRLTVRTFLTEHNGLPRASLAVCDTGIGMTPEILAQAQEPFFTTRGQQGGTGIGLATVTALIERFGGQLSLHSTLGQGTSVEASLPLLEPGATRPLQPHA